MKSGLNRIQPDRRDFSLVHTYGAVLPPPETLPAAFSIYTNEPIPNQELQDTRFTPPLDPMPYGCTGETGAFESGLQDETLYNPLDLYLNTQPGTLDTGRDIRDMLKTLINRGPRKADGTFGEQRTAYFNCYGSGAIDDFDAARIALWINQYEKRGVYIGSWWYGYEWQSLTNGVLPTPDYKTAEATLHCYLVVGWEDDYLIAIPWCGDSFGDGGKVRISRAIFNALLAQPYTGAFTITKTTSKTPIPIGYIAVIDHLVAFIRQLFKA